MPNPFQFNNRFVEQLPSDPELRVFPRQVAESCYSIVAPTAVAAPQLVHASNEVMEVLGLKSGEQKRPWFVDVFSGNQLLEGMQPFAMRYGGHQFGQWAGQLGDGRAINLGEIIDVDGNNQTLQLKGAGLTPYSRNADGLAVLRSSVREYLCSEAMYHLGVPTTRALSLCLTGEQVPRDMFYDGHAELEPGAVVCRVAPSFLRFGNFQIHAAQQEPKVLEKLIKFCIRNDFPQLLTNQEDDLITAEIIEQWFDEICIKTADMINHWMRVGFVHGVMNTDNMSILGLTIDYGPYGWLEGYDPDWTPNTTDAQGRRYAYGNQPKVAQWNLFQLANALVNQVGRSEKLEKSLQDFADYYSKQSQRMYAQKLGLQKYVTVGNSESFDQLIADLLEILTLTETDMTIFFRKLADINAEEKYNESEIFEIIFEAFYIEAEVTGKIAKDWSNWLKRYQSCLQVQPVEHNQKVTLMNKVNPKYVLRNYLAQQAIDKAAEGNFSEVDKLLDIMRRPYAEQPENESYAAKRPDWARHKAGCSMLSCSS